MIQKFSKLHAISIHLKQVVVTNALTLVNGIFFTVTFLLVIFGETHEALFLFVILFLNVVIGIIQDLRAKIALEQLQIFMAPKVTRILNNLEEIISLEEIKHGDKLKIAMGDQIPADGELILSNGLEVNEALITGESNDIQKAELSKVLAGSIVTAGNGILIANKTSKESFVSQMTEKIKEFTTNLSPIQKTLNTFITYMTYLLLGITIYVVVHGIAIHELVVAIIKDIAALTSTLVPQGLILATTIFFAYGAIKMFKKQVLLQEINATEKLGRIKNLCVDKTGTLTENQPVLESRELNPQNTFNPQTIDELTDAYIQANGDKSETIKAIKKTLQTQFSGKVISSLPFSSSRKYGTAKVIIDNQEKTSIMGAPDILIDKITDEADRLWLKNKISEHAKEAKRLLLLALVSAETPEGLPQLIRPVCLYVLQNPLRPGTREIIDFFQNRKVSIRVISGDNPQTVQAIAEQAGIKQTDIIITGPEMEKWDNEAWLERVPAYHLFARISPEQKQKIVEVLKLHGFTAMVGDGANDALAIKKSDLGIAMFGGASATRQIAQIVLMNDSFAALPTGVNLAETIITNIELVAGIFFNKVAIGVLLFFGLAILGYTYPLSPRNTTIINYFSIWLPMVYWAIFPAHLGIDQGKQNKQHMDGSFLKRVLPFAVINGALTAAAAILVFSLGPNALKFAGSNILVVLVLIVLGYWFFILVPKTFGIIATKKQKQFQYALAGAGIAFVTYVMLTPSISKFFDLRKPQLLPLVTTICITFFCALAQYYLTKSKFYKI